MDRNESLPVASVLDSIEPNLFLGSEKDAQNIEALEKNKVTHILTINDRPLSSIVKETLPHLHIKYINLKDNGLSDLLSHFDDTYEFIKEGLLHGAVLVHCQMGASRSASVIIAYLMKKYKLTHREAFDKVELKKIICPNKGFVSQLENYGAMGCTTIINNQTSKKTYFVSELTRIEPNLYLGTEAKAKNRKIIKKYEITHILTINDVPLPNLSLPCLQIMYIKLEDISTSDLLSHLDQTYQFIKEGLTKGAVLVHSQNGASRSASVVIAYLMKKYKLMYREALNKVKTKKMVFPNIGFISQLEKYKEMDYTSNFVKPKNSYPSSITSFGKLLAFTACNIKQQ